MLLALWTDRPYIQLGRFSETRANIIHSQCFFQAPLQGGNATPKKVHCPLPPPGETFELRYN